MQHFLYSFQLRLQTTGNIDLLLANGHQEFLYPHIKCALYIFWHYFCLNFQRGLLCLGISWLCAHSVFTYFSVPGFFFRDSRQSVSCKVIFINYSVGLRQNRHDQAGFLALRHHWYPLAISHPSLPCPWPTSPPTYHHRSWLGTLMVLVLHCQPSVLVTHCHWCSCISVIWTLFQQNANSINRLMLCTFQYMQISLLFAILYVFMLLAHNQGRPF